MQRIYARVDSETVCLRLPDAQRTLLDDVRWGEVSDFFSPAFWKAQVWQHALHGHYQDPRLGRTLQEEVAACLLGGFGIPAELGLAAFARLQARGLIGPSARESDLVQALLEPLYIEDRPRQYRFARQKARYLYESFAYLCDLDEPDDDVALRDHLTGAPGIGLKTASWVVRNHRASDRIAILDVHIMRACALVGLFDFQAVTPAKYFELECAYLRFADALDVRAGVLDAVIWGYMRVLRGARETPVAC